MDFVTVLVDSLYIQVCDKDTLVGTNLLQLFVFIYANKQVNILFLKSSKQFYSIYVQSKK